MSEPKEPFIKSNLSGWIGLGILLIFLLLQRNSSQPNWQIASQCIAIMFLPMAIIEGIQSKGTGIIWKQTPRTKKPIRFLTRIIGLATTILITSSAYWLFPEYSGKFYDAFYAAITTYWPWLVGFFLITTWIENRKNPEDIKDPNYQIGKFLISWKKPTLTKEEWKNHFLGWLIKIYFLPLMFTYFTSYIGKIHIPNNPTNLQYYDFAYQSIFLIDTAFVCIGYIFANKITGTHIRSADKTASGWASALICYQPLWSVIGLNYIAYGQNWGTALPQSPTVHAWYGTLIILVTIPYLWATLAFGTRFSNLTHRGILYVGPYKYTKHPAYISKLTAYFFTFTPFLATSPTEIARNLIVFAILCGIYRIRATTEEKNLRSYGPDYDIYCKLVKENQMKMIKQIKNLI